MDPATTDLQAREARMLAAIVFTDVVGFSKLAAQNEARVYGALQRDMSVMSSLCRSHGGQVLNTMGDGMLLCFASAVDALSCAVEIQRTLHSQAHSLPSVEVLHHRIGVHLGDVIMNGDNVFGDGVNVAARLQALAKPDAVCFSHTVWEVVKNKLKFDAKYLGPRQLKNLGEPVRVWQVPPIDDISGNDDPVTSTIGVLTADVQRAEVPVWKMVGLSGICLLLVGILAFGFMRMKPPPKDRFDATGAVGHGDLRNVFEKIKDRKLHGGSETPASADASPPESSALTVDSALAQLQDLKPKFQFAEIVSLLEKLPLSKQEQCGNIEDYRQLASLNQFLSIQIQDAQPTNFVNVPSFEVSGDGTASEAHVYGRSGQIVISTASTGESSVGFSALSPKQYFQIATAVLNKPVDGNPPPPNLLVALKLFAKEYELPPS